MASSSAWSSNGFFRKAIAAFSNAVCRTRLFSCAVMNITGNFEPEDFNCCCNSMPVIPGKRTSRINTSGLSIRPEPKKSSADWNVSALNPADSNKSFSDRDTDSSSSITNMHKLVSITRLSDTPVLLNYFKISAARQIGLLFAYIRIFTPNME